MNRENRIAASGILSWLEINEQKSFELDFRTEQSGYLELELLAWSESDWRIKEYESAVLRIFVQGEYNQDCILFYGNHPLSYTRVLGRFDPGNYRLRIEFNRTASSQEVSRAFIQTAEIGIIREDSPMYLIYRNAPVLYGRNVYHPYENRYTDTPLVLFYSLNQQDNETVIEYQMMFSHEDEGTPTPLLMSKWGRTTDIEWIYRVFLDGDGAMMNAVFQGRRHATTPFEGTQGMGGNPILQIATTNGMVDHAVTSDYRFFLPPSRQWDPEREPRERVMDAFPFTYQVTAWEMLRQYPMEEPVIANSFQLADLRDYLYVQTAKSGTAPDQKTSVDIQVKLKHIASWFSSSHGDLRQGNFRCAYDGPFAHFSTTVKLPPGMRYEDIEQVCAVWLPAGEETVSVSEFKAFFLDEDYIPQPAIRSADAVCVTKDNPRQVVWDGGK